MKSTVAPCLAVSVAVIAAYHLGRTSGLGDGHNAGLFGTAVATMGMLSSACYILAINNYGPIADNAGGIAEMSQQPEHVRETTDRLDAAGNVTKAITKGYSIGSAALACFLLFGAFLDEFSQFAGKPFRVVDIAVPEVLVGGLIGALVFMLGSRRVLGGGALTDDTNPFFTLPFSRCRLPDDLLVRRPDGRGGGQDGGRGGEGSAAAVPVRESDHASLLDSARPFTHGRSLLQYSNDPDIMTFKSRPDYRTCVALVTSAALQEMVLPGLLATGLPILVGLIFRFVGSLTGRPMLGASFSFATLEQGDLIVVILMSIQAAALTRWPSDCRLSQSHTSVPAHVHQPQPGAEALAGYLWCVRRRRNRSKRILIFFSHSTSHDTTPHRTASAPSMG